MIELLTPEETRKWLETRRLTDADGAVSFSNTTLAGSYRIPPDSGAKTLLSRQLVELVLTSDTSCLLWIDEWGIWPSAEDMVLFDGFRQSLGERARLWEKPGHVADRSETGVLRSLTAIVLYFVWGAYLVVESGGIIVRISHDEMVDIYLRDGHPNAADTLAGVSKICEAR